MVDSLHAVLRCDGTERALFLEPVSKSPEEDYQASELDEAEELLWVLTPIGRGCDAAIESMRKKRSTTHRLAYRLSRRPSCVAGLLRLDR